jgi:hypothetical protein
VDNRPEYILRLHPMPSGVPIEVRLRAVLKRLLRAHQFKCLEIRQVGAGRASACPLPNEPVTEEGHQ